MPDAERSSNVAAELRRHAAWMEGRAPVLDPAALRQRAERETRTRTRPFVLPTRTSSRARWQFMVAAAAVFVLFAGVLVAARRDRVQDPVMPVPTPAPSTWEELPILDLPAFPYPPNTHIARTDPVPVWTGTELVLVGLLANSDVSGEQVPFPPIPALNLESRTWRLIEAPTSTLSGNGYHATWTGTEIVFVGSSRTSPPQFAGMAYDPASDEWRSIADPWSKVDGPLIWADGRVLTWSYGVGVLGYDPSSDEWTRVTNEQRIGDQLAPGSTAGPTMSTSSVDLVWTGAELVMADRSSQAVAAFDPATKTWRSLPDKPGDVSSGRLAWTGRYVGLADGDQIAWFDPAASSASPSSAWTTMAMSGSVSVWLLDRYVSWATVVTDAETGSTSPVSPGAGGVLRRLDSSRMASVPGLPTGTIAFTGATVAGDRVVAWGIAVDDERVPGDLTIRAAEISTDALAEP